MLRGITCIPYTCLLSMDAAIRSNATKKKKTSQTLENKFLFELHSCSKAKDLCGAISLYDAAVSNNTRLNQHHFNALLYLCSNSVTNPLLKDSALKFGFRIFDHMSSTLGINLNEASITTVARLAAAKGDGNYAFELVKNMGKYNVSPRLRTYDPALFCFCELLDGDKAYEVEEHMNDAGLSLEEAELAALLKVSVKNGRAERVYEYLHKLRSTVRCVTESTALVIEEWFRSSKASEVGDMNLDAGRVKEGILRNGGGWHGQGWVGHGDWIVCTTSVDVDGHCSCCREQLVCVDIDDEETEKFAQSIAALAMEREVKSNFTEFQGWLETHACYEAIVDGANVGLYQQNFAEGGFSIYQLDDVVKELYNQSGKKWPLVILHNKRLRGLMENPSGRKLLEEWMNNGVLYTSPNGSNDDWYWLFAAVKLKCLLVTNDEMRDHIFELLGSNFFNQWKERHQVHYTFVKGNLKLQMPPSYSLVMQESEKGSWHVPLASGISCESSRSWLCITRPSALDSVATVSNGVDTSENSQFFHHCDSIDPHLPERFANEVCSLDSQVDENNTTSLIGKRKERSPP
ncbi:proteinaceous RNase P 2-like [Gastrolobium bilobum]|uniref:proteinaceous RNase P 2-like n=1 Tax=Gastrolobium bilobum TaxID=150636 RepID=UPI002AB2967A|nr:proteinaceous RNase P 2-like [Gastrolobium bilobum]XP_061363243.1 proteinaceous RNase P 2-like [Gastrolobium bilobum]